MAGPTLTKRHVANAKTATSSSRALQIRRTRRSVGGRAINQTETLTPAQVRLRKEVEEKEEEAWRAALTEQQRCDIPDPYDDNDSFNGYEQDVLRGRMPADISHAGEDLTDDAVEDAEQTLLEKLRAHHNKLWSRRRDNRTRGDRTQIRVNAFAAQMPQMVDAYMDWALDTAEGGLGNLYKHPEDAIVEATLRVYVGLLPVAPHFPSVVITARALEVFRVTQLRCPCLGVQPFVRALCDIHGTAPRSYLSTQFSIAFDVYLAIRAGVDSRVQVALGRDTLDWRLKNACPACLYKLEGEPVIPLPFLATIDGNNSLKRFWHAPFQRREREEVGADGKTVLCASKERKDDRVPPGDYYLTREEVDKWSKEGLDELMKEFVPGSELADEGDGCTERWQNMREDVTARAYGMYDETGIFPALCRHGFVLVVVDMVKSGELAKYGFAITAHFLLVLRELGLGYDIGCKFGKMVRMHPALAQLANDNNFKALVGSFHGHAHNRRCQLTNLSTYVRGMGLEDLEGCESFFSKSNALASTTRYATAFHRQQTITCYLKHADMADAYQGLSLLLVSKYRRALKIKGTEARLREAMAAMGVESRSVFETWLEREKDYLSSLLKEPEHETLQMEYYQKLVNLLDHEERVDVIRKVACPFMPAETDTTYAAAAAQTRRVETQRHHALEVYAKTLDAVQELELKLGVQMRWQQGDEDWVAAATMVENRRYQRAIDELEGLVVARMFELSKVNMSDTGYKLRKHIAKALQARSKAVKTALERYNEAASAMVPARTVLTWEQIVDYAFLADFDLLREGREDIRSEPWAQAAGRAAMDQHFKLLCADEEIARLNLEIPRLVTHMVDEEAFLIHHDRRLRDSSQAALAHQVALHRMQRGRFNSLHMERLVKLSKEPGFTASLSPGVSVNKERRILAASTPDSDVEMRDIEPPQHDDPTFLPISHIPPWSSSHAGPAT
ncbi:hypothetical protein B0H13DRAFT_2378621 [Mycena leptocephala]|nr:hypothetical protein B0H13DRAFT_2378621 [Mycena leptocephala]